MPKSYRTTRANNCSAFIVDGTLLPDVNFDIGESYAGLIPITANEDETQKLFFWFFPSENPAASDEIIIWYSDEISFVLNRLEC